MTIDLSPKWLLDLLDLCRVVSSNYYGRPKLPILHCCLYLQCLQSNFMLQDINICEGWSTWLLLPCFGIQWTSLDTGSFLFLKQWPAKRPLLSLIFCESFVGHILLPMNVVHCPQHPCVAAIQVPFHFIIYCPCFTAVQEN